MMVNDIVIRRTANGFLVEPYYTSGAPPMFIDMKVFQRLGWSVGPDQNQEQSLLDFIAEYFSENTDEPSRD